MFGFNGLLLFRCLVALCLFLSCTLECVSFFVVVLLFAFVCLLEVVLVFVCLLFVVLCVCCFCSLFECLSVCLLCIFGTT